MRTRLAMNTGGISQEGGSVNRYVSSIIESQRVAIDLSSGVKPLILCPNANGCLDPPEKTKLFSHASSFKSDLGSLHL